MADHLRGDYMSLSRHYASRAIIRADRNPLKRARALLSLLPRAYRSGAWSFGKMDLVKDVIAMSSPSIFGLCSGSQE